jgi:hypothetical protein
MSSSEAPTSGNTMPPTAVIPRRRATRGGRWHRRQAQATGGAPLRPHQAGAHAQQHECRAEHHHQRDPISFCGIASVPGFQLPQAQDLSRLSSAGQRAAKFLHDASTLGHECGVIRREYAFLEVDVVLEARANVPAQQK